MSITQAEMEEATRQAYKIRNEFSSIDPRSLFDVKDGPWICPGPASFDGVWTVHVQGGFLYPPETHWGWVNFEGDVKPGAVKGGGVGFAIMAVSLDELVDGGDVDCNFNAGGVTPGVWSFNFKRGSRFLGSFGGGGLVEGLAVSFGTVKFKRGRPSA
jgi:hypothetical protein